MNKKNLFFILILINVFYSTTILCGLVDQYFSWSSNLDILSKLSVQGTASKVDDDRKAAKAKDDKQAKLKPTPSKESINITLKNINLQSPDAKNKEAFVKGLETFSNTPDARSSIGTIAKIKAYVIELLKIDKNLVNQAEKILENIGFSKEQIDKEVSRFKKTKQTPVQAPTGASKIDIKNFAHIKIQLDTIKAMNVSTPERKEDQRDKANEYMSVLEDYVLKNKDTLIKDANKIQEIEANAKAILSITPLTISTVVKTLKNAGFGQKYIYDLITGTYQKQIKFIESEEGLGSRNISKKGELPHKGPCDDISDALSYGIAISSEVIPLKTKLDVEGGLDKNEDDFLKEITALQAGLDAFLKSSDQIKQAFSHCTGLTVDEYSKMIEIKRPVYCRMSNWEHSKLLSGECTPYISFYGLLENINELINNYTKEKKLNKIQKMNIQQKIINQLNNFIYYNTPSAKVQICQHCLARDIFRWVKGNEHPEDYASPGGQPPVPQAHKDYENDLNAEFKKITDFFEQLPIKEKNAGTENGIVLANHIRQMLRKSFAEDSRIHN